jgi:hypothetical protein
LFPSVLALTPASVASGPVHVAQDRFFATYASSKERPDMGSTVGWDPAMLIVDVLRKLGPRASSEQIRSYLNGLHGWSGINGVYDFRDGGQRGIGQNAVIIARYDAARNSFVGVSKRGGFLK